MSNPNNIPSQQIDAWCDDYAALCKTHGLYLVANDQIWLQSAGEMQDSTEAVDNMRHELQAF